MWYHGPSPKMVINLSKTYEKLSCKGEPYQFSDWRDPLVTADTHTHTQTSCYFIIRICDTLPEIVIILSRTYEIYKGNSYRFSNYRYPLLTDKLTNNPVTFM